MKTSTITCAAAFLFATGGSAAADFMWCYKLPLAPRSIYYSDIFPGVVRDRFTYELAFERYLREVHAATPVSGSCFGEDTRRQATLARREYATESLHSSRDEIWTGWIYKEPEEERSLPVAPVPSRTAG